MAHYVLRRGDTRELFAGFELRAHKMVAQWTSQSDDMYQPVIYKEINPDGQAGLITLLSANLAGPVPVLIWCEVTIGG